MLTRGTQRINESGHLEIGGCDAIVLAREFGTPLYVLDEAQVRGLCREYVEHFTARYPDVTVSFAGKALLTKAVCAIVHSEGLHLDACSAGELYTALEAGFPPEHIIFHGNYKTQQELQMCIDNHVGLIVADSLGELAEIDQLGASNGTDVDVSIRVSPGIKARTHTYTQTGQLDSKFGLGVEYGAAMEGIIAADEMERLALRGIHCHLGSPIFALEAYERATEIMVDLMVEARQQHGIELAELDLGGGLGIRYTHEDTPPSIEHFADVLCSAVLKCCTDRAIDPPALAVEPGRSIVGEAGTTLYTVGVIKEIPGVRTYVAIDGGLSDNPRPTLYDAEYEAIIANKADQPARRAVRIAGRHCETDTLIPDTTVQEPERGDILAVFSTGAYNYSMASNYNRFARPAMVLVNDGAAELIVERETLADLLRQDVLPKRLQAQADAVRV
ncbi:MAG: diaminopimelate decarboxylase [Armatimonadota bacterium]|jgi:diaminopimelate decarboxylase